MSKIELISNKLQEMLGNNYAIFPISHFRKNYTEARMINDNGNIGYATYTNSQYGDFRKDKVVGILNFVNASRSNVSFYNLSTSYKIEFSVPRNVWKTNASGQFIETPKFVFENDIEELITSIINAKLQLDEDFYAKMTMGEPSYVTTEKDGEFDYDIYQVNGQIVISDKANFGSDYSVSFLIDNEYVELDDITDYTESYDVNSNAIQKQGKVKTEQNPAVSGWVATATIDDVETENEARQFVYNIVHSNIEIVNPTGTSEKLKREIPVKITSPHGDIHEFNAIISIDFRTTENGTGSYVISMIDDGE